MMSVAMFMFAAAMGQNNGATQWEDALQEDVGDYVRSTTTPINSPVVDYVDKITVGKTMPFWVWPSAVYNPNFDFSTILPNASRTVIENGVVSDFAWKEGEFGADVTATENAFDSDGAIAGYTKNYVEIAFHDLGQRLIQVIESPAAGICPADAVWFGVNVIAEPMVRFANAGNTEAGVPNTIAIGCAGSTEVAEAVTSIGIALDNNDEVEIGATDNSRYHINLNYTVYNVDIDGATGNLNWGVTESVTTVESPSINVFGADGTTPVSQANPLLAENTDLIAGQNYGLEGAKATVYEYTLVNWNAGISRKSDYIAMRDAGAVYTDYGSFTYYSDNIASDPVLVNRIVVLPNPATGPIYHIPNNFSL